MTETRFQDHVFEQPVIQPLTRFKASWLVGWAEVNKFDQVDPVTGQVWVDDQLPQGPPPLRTATNINLRRWVTGISL